jgi:hypothetical protein
MAANRVMRSKLPSGGVSRILYFCKESILSFSFSVFMSVDFGYKDSVISIIIEQFLIKIGAQICIMLQNFLSLILRNYQ